MILVSSSNKHQACSFSPIIAATAPVTISSVKDTSSTNVPVTSIDSVVSELPTIIDPDGFCMCLGVEFPKCRQFRDHQECTKDTVKQIVEIWYHQTKNPSWDQVVEALLCRYRYRDAAQLADRKGVKQERL